MKVSAYLRFDQRTRCVFALPIFTHGQGGEPFIQIVDEYLNTVTRYAKLDDAPPEGLDWISNNEVSTDTSTPTYAFIDEHGSLVLGTSDQLESHLRRAIDRGILSIDVQLQALELVGSSIERATARRAMRQLILDSSGASAAHAYYEGSALRSALWDGLLARAPNVEAAHRFIRIRSSIIPAIAPGGHITVDLSAAAPGDRAWMDAPDLFEELQNEFGGVSVTASLLDGAEPPPPPDIKPSIISTISKASRHEERISLLLRASLADPEMALAVLSTYRDKSKFGNMAADIIRYRLSNNGNRTPDLAIALAIHEMYSRVFPRTRGELLFFLTYHLSRYPTINQLLSNIVSRSQSIYVAPYRKRILDCLTEGRAASRPVPEDEVRELAHPTPLPLFGTD